MSKPALSPLDILLAAVEEAQDELLAYLEPGSPRRSAEATIDKLTHLLEDPEVLDAMMMLGWTPPWHRPGARKPPAPST